MSRARWTAGRSRAWAVGVALLVPTVALAACGSGNAASKVAAVIGQAATRAALASTGGLELAFRPHAGSAAVSGQSLSKTVGIITQRLSALGVSKSWVGTRGHGASIEVVVLAADSSAQRVQQEAGATAKLRIYDWEANVVGRSGQVEPSNAVVTGGSQAGASQYGLSKSQADHTAQINPGTIVVRALPTEASNGPPANPAPSSWYVIKDTPVLTNAGIAKPEDLATASGPAALSLGFTAPGAQTLQQLVSRLARRAGGAQLPGVSASGAAQHFAVVVDGQLLAVPSVSGTSTFQGVAPSGRLQVGTAAGPGAQVLADVLRSGELPVGLTLTAIHRTPTPGSAPASTAVAAPPSSALSFATLPHRYTFTLTRPGGYSFLGTLAFGAPVRVGEAAVTDGRETFVAGEHCEPNPAADAAIPAAVQLANTTPTFPASGAAFVESAESGQSPTPVEVAFYLPSGVNCNRGLAAGGSFQWYTTELQPGHSTIQLLMIYVKDYYSPNKPQGDATRLAGEALAVGGSVNAAGDVWTVKEMQGPHVSGSDGRFRIPLAAK
jgi:hypothetical protein